MKHNITITPFELFKLDTIRKLAIAYDMKVEYNDDLNRLSLYKIIDYDTKEKYKLPKDMVALIKDIEGIVFIDVADNQFIHDSISYSILDVD
jgi:hypothetical protein